VKTGATLLNVADISGWL